MKLSKITLSLIAILLCSTSAALGYVYGSTNFGFGGYPEFKDKHYRPSPPYSRDTYSVQRYRQEVETYLEEAKRYVETANNDIDRINEAKQNAIKEANETIDEYNRFVRGY